MVSFFEFIWNWRKGDLTSIVEIFIQNVISKLKANLQMIVSCSQLLSGDVVSNDQRIRTILYHQASAWDWRTKVINYSIVDLNCTFVGSKEDLKIPGTPSTRNFIRIPSNKDVMRHSNNFWKFACSTVFWRPASCTKPIKGSNEENSF